MNPSIEKHLEDFQAACKKLNISSELPQAPNQSQSFQDFIQANAMLVVLISAKKDNRQPNYNDEKWKYFPWWDMETYGDAPAGSGFRLGGVFDEFTFTDVGAPFVSESDEDARKLATKYVELYKIIMKPIHF